MSTIRHVFVLEGVNVRIAKPLLLVSTPIGIVGGLYEAFRLAGGLAFIMVALVALTGAAAAMLIRTIRREHRRDQALAGVQVRLVNATMNSEQP